MTSTHNHSPDISPNRQVDLRACIITMDADSSRKSIQNHSKSSDVNPTVHPGPWRSFLHCRATPIIHPRPAQPVPICLLIPRRPCRSSLRSCAALAIHPVPILDLPVYPGPAVPLILAFLCHPCHSSCVSPVAHLYAPVPVCLFILGWSCRSFLHSSAILAIHPVPVLLLICTVPCRSACSSWAGRAAHCIPVPPLPFILCRPCRSFVRFRASLAVHPGAASGAHRAAPGPVAALIGQPWGRMRRSSGIPGAGHPWRLLRI